MLNFISILTLAFLTFAFGFFAEEEVQARFDMNGKADLLSVTDVPQEWEALFSEGFLVTFDEQEFVFEPQRKDVKIANGNVSFEEPFLDFMIEVLEGGLNRETQHYEIVDANGEGTRQVEVSEPHMDGQELLADEMKESIQKALSAGLLEDEALVMVHAAGVANESGMDLGSFELLSTGVSNFNGSDGNRIFNINRGLTEFMHGVLIPPGEEFSFNEALGGVSLEYSDGWRAALGIFQAEDLEYIPGGGICQVSVTMYRAALGAGLDIVEQRNHSLWVHYYGIPSEIEGTEGKGLDATIYPGIQDFVFRNNTESNILIEAYTEGDHAVVNFYGESDDRVVILEGPYTASTYTEEVYEEFGRSLGIGEVVWKQIVSWPDGRNEETWLHSSYHSVVPQR